MKFKQKMKAWIFKHARNENGPPRAHPAPSAGEQNRKRILKDLESFLIDRKSLSEIRDETELPYPKSVLLNAITLEILHTEDETRVEYLKNSATCLVDFQRDVGPEPVTLLGINDSQVLSNDNRHSIAKQDPITRIELNPQGKKYRTLRNAAEFELEKTLRRLTAVTELRKKAATASTAIGV